MIAECLVYVYRSPQEFLITSGAPIHGAYVLRSGTADCCDVHGHVMKPFQVLHDVLGEDALDPDFNISGPLHHSHPKTHDLHSHDPVTATYSILCTTACCFVYLDGAAYESAMNAWKRMHQKTTRKQLHDEDEWTEEAALHVRRACV